MIKPGAVVVTLESPVNPDKTVGDLDRGVYERDDLTITPERAVRSRFVPCSRTSSGRLPMPKPKLACLIAGKHRYNAINKEIAGAGNYFKRRQTAFAPW